MDTNHMFRVIANKLLHDAKKHGVYFCGPHSRKVYLASIPGVDLADPECTYLLDKLRRLGLVEFARCDLVAAADPDLVEASSWVQDIGYGVKVENHFLVVS